MVLLHLRSVTTRSASRSGAIRGSAMCRYCTDEQTVLVRLLLRLLRLLRRKGTLDKTTS